MAEVPWGTGKRTLGRIDAIGVDEIQYAKGHKYLTLLAPESLRGRGFVVE